jgi:hypothetical protein
MNNIVLDYQADAGDRIKALLADHPVPHEQLRGAIAMAGEQLELLKPIRMQIPRSGQLEVAAVTNTLRGAILVVLADAAKVVTMHLGAYAERQQEFGELARRMHADMREAGCKFTDGKAVDEVLQTIRVLLRDHGAKPGKAAARAMPPQRGERALGILLASIPQAELAELLERLERLSDNGVCPAMIGLLGPGSDGRDNSFSGAWPVLLPLAPYLDEGIAE